MDHFPGLNVPNSVVEIPRGIQRVCSLNILICYLPWMGQKHQTACYWSWLMHHTSSCQNFTSFPHGITRVTCEHLGYGKAIIIYESMIYMIYDIIEYYRYYVTSTNLTLCWMVLALTHPVHLETIQPDLTHLLETKAAPHRETNLARMT